MLRSLVGPLVLTCAAAFAQTATAPSFDVVSVKMVNPGQGERPATHSDAGRIDYHLVRMKTLVLRAWNVEDYQVVWPAWVEGRNAYDVSATMPADTTKEQLQLMLRDLLTRRFGISVHRETRDTKVYALEVSPRGLKILPAKNPPANEESMGVYNDVSPGRSWKVSSKNSRGPEMPSGVTIARFIRALPKLDRVVMDRTELKGFYDVTLNIPLDAAPEVPTTGRGGEIISVSTGPTQSQLMDALEKQLGLRVEAKTLPIEMLVIDRLERIPTEN